MNIKIKDYQLAFKSHKLYEVILEDVQIETLVTHYPSMVKAWINNTEILNDCRLHRLIVGLDVEWRPNFKNVNENPVATLQLCVGNSCLIFQILNAPSIPRCLREFLLNPDYTFVGVGIKRDVKKLNDHYGLEVSNKRDLRPWAVKELDRKELQNYGLPRLVKEILGKKYEKPEDVTLSSWDVPLLRRDQVTYACLDAYFSFEIGRRLSSWY